MSLLALVDPLLAAYRSVREAGPVVVPISEHECLVLTTSGDTLVVRVMELHAPKTKAAVTASAALLPSVSPAVAAAPFPAVTVTADHLRALCKSAAAKIGVDKVRELLGCKTVDEVPADQRADRLHKIQEAMK
jgi:hypothetical protein